MGKHLALRLMVFKSESNNRSSLRNLWHPPKQRSPHWKNKGHHLRRRIQRQQHTSEIRLWKKCSLRSDRSICVTEPTGLRDACIWPGVKARGGYSEHQQRRLHDHLVDLHLLPEYGCRAVHCLWTGYLHGQRRQLYDHFCDSGQKQ